jgi:uncharacterized protein YfaS (alpha-2-macroglobulin family)
MPTRQWIAQILLCILPLAGVAATETDSPRAEEVELSAYGLGIHFSEPMLTWLGSAAPQGIDITPPLDCRWSWSSDTQLNCYENEGKVRPASTYEVAIHGGLWSQKGEPFKSQVLSLESPRPEIVFPLIDHWDGGVPVIEFSSNAPVGAAALQAALALVVDEREVRFELEPAANDDQVPASDQHTAWRVVYSPADAMPHSLVLRARPGLRTTLGPLPGTQDEVLLRARVNESFRLRQVGCSERYPANYSSTSIGQAKTQGQRISFECPAGQQLVFDFSRPLAEASLAWMRENLPRGLRFEKVELARANRVAGMQLKDAERPGQLVYIVVERAKRRFELDLPESIMAEDGTHLAQAAEVSIGATDFLPGLTLTPAQMLVPLGSRPPKLISTLNLPAIKIEQTELGADELLKQSGTLARSRKNIQVQKAPQPPTTEIRVRGGLVEGKLTSATGTGFSAETYAVVYAAFNVTVSEAGSQFLVWATDWTQAAPVSGARVELLSMKGQDSISELASAMTDADGVALVDGPEAQGDRARGSLFVRVTGRDGKRAIVPLLSSLTSSRAREREDPYNMPEEGETLNWGVTDRPIYHPGDTVRYRLWIRTRRENHLRTARGSESLKFTLGTQYDGTTITQFEATPDSYGSVAGELKLPSSIHDNNYCISMGPESSGYADGACFRVSGYHVNNMWAELNVDRKLVRNGDTITLDAEAGYFSGGPAVAAKTTFQSLLTPMRLEDAYPDFRSFTFIDPYEKTAGDGGDSFWKELREDLVTDIDGHARRSATLFMADSPDNAETWQQRPIPFGNLDLTASVSTSSSNWASAPARLIFSRYPRFVGLKVTPWFLDGTSDPELEAVVITDAGIRVDDAKVLIDIVETQAGAERKEVIVGHCEMLSGQAASCPFRPKHSGVFRFLASSDGAAATAVARYASIGDGWKSAAGTETKMSLSVDNDHPAIGTQAELILQQPFAKARVLVSVEHGRVLKHWIEHADSQAIRIRVPVEPDWSPGVTINAVVLDAGSEAFGAHASSAALVQMTSVDLFPSGGARPMPLAISLDRKQVRPGERAKIGLHNPRATSVQVTLAVVDDAARALEPEFIDAVNPAGSSWLGKLDHWTLPDWYGLGSWPRQLGGEARWQPTFVHFASEADPNQERLDTIVVTGSNIRAVDIFQKGAQADHSLGRPAVGASSATAMRNRFAESALWRTDLVLGPGSDQSVEVDLPDNLTRWRVLAWANDADDGFALSESTIEASLPIEIRNETPTRLFPGDRASIGASIRTHGSAATVHAQLNASGAGVAAGTHWNAVIAANSQRAISVQVEPRKTGEIAMETRARSSSAADGIGAVVEVASPEVHQRLPVAGWLPEEGVQLKLPTLPTGASKLAISLQASRGLGALADDWTRGLRDYPHRCWEQILSRAVGAAAAIRLGSTDATWPEASSVVEEALQVAGQFQDDQGGSHFFTGENGWEITPSSLMLTAYTVQSFEFLRAMGYKVPEQIEAKARKALTAELGPHDYRQNIVRTPYWNEELVAAAAVLAPQTPIEADTLNALWTARETLGWYGRANLARALAVRPGYEEKTQALLESLRAAGVRHGMARAIEQAPNSTSPFQSRTRDQCGVVVALSKLDVSANARTLRAEYLRGLADLYAGGAAVLDTQASAQCLMALVQLQEEISDPDSHVEFEISDEGDSKILKLAPGQSAASWTQEYSLLPAQLNVRSSAAKDSLLSFVANVEYDLDGRHSPSTAVGFLLDRQYSVIRDHAWKDASNVEIHEGEWVRITLKLTTSRLRRFVAVSDIVPGGLRPTDLALSGQTDAEILGIQTSDSPWFPARQVDDRNARFYSEQLPPGTHEINYYTRAAHAGRFAALPAVAELMYGNTSVSRTSSATIEIHAAATGHQP